MSMPQIGFMVSRRRSIRNATGLLRGLAFARDTPYRQPMTPIAAALSLGLQCAIASPVAQPSFVLSTANPPIPPASQPIDFPAPHPLEDMSGASLTPVSGAINSTVLVCNPLGESMFVGEQPPAPVPSLLAANLRLLIERAGSGAGSASIKPPISKSSPRPRCSSSPVP